MLDGVFYLERAAQVPGESLPLFSGMTYSKWRAVIPGGASQGQSRLQGDDLQ